MGDSDQDSDAEFEDANDYFEQQGDLDILQCESGVVVTHEDSLGAASPDVTAAATRDEQEAESSPRPPSATPPSTSQARPPPSASQAPPRPPPRPSSAGKTPPRPPSAGTTEDNLAAVGEIELDSPDSPQPQLEPRLSPEGSASPEAAPAVATNSNLPDLTDEEILAMCTIKCLDDGQATTLDKAEELLPKTIDPISLMIARITNDYTTQDNDEDSDESSVVPDQTLPDRKSKRPNLKKFASKAGNSIKKSKAGQAVKKNVSKVSKKVGKKDSQESNEVEVQEEDNIQTYPAKHYKHQTQFNILKMQDLTGHHQGTVWVMKFSKCGRLLATAGRDKVVNMWVLRTALPHFQQKREHQNPDIPHREPDENSDGLFDSTPFFSFHGHTGDILDLNWSKNLFLLSSSMDKTVRLWHVSKVDCLCCFQHSDVVPAIAFHPLNDNYFLSGSLDGKLRLWYVPTKKVKLWNEVDKNRNQLITAINFCEQGKKAVVGTYDGRIMFYDTEGLTYYTQKEMVSRTGRGKKVTGIEPVPGDDTLLLITSNDSRLRLYDLKDCSITVKFKGLENNSSQIKACFSHDGRYIISGSENHFVYIWDMEFDPETIHQSGLSARVAPARRDRNHCYERFCANKAVVTSTVFSPVALTENELIVKEIFVVADYAGDIKVYINIRNLDPT